MKITETELRNQIIRECNDTSQTAVADRLQISRAYISDIVAGKRRISRTIARAFGFRPLPLDIVVERQYERMDESESAPTANQS